jgi:PAP2 superfamily
VVLVAALYLVFVQTRPGQRIDDAALEGRDALAAEEIDAADDLLRSVDVASVALLGGAIVGVALVRGQPRLALAAGAVIVGANVTTQVLKKVLPRPDRLASDPLSIGNTLPSGHATVAMSIALAAVLVASPRYRGVVAVGGTLYGASMGVATLTAGWHRPSDAAAAFAVVVAWTAVAATWVLHRRVPGEAQPGAPVRPLAAPLLVVGGVVLGAVSFAGLVAAVAARRLGRLDAVDLGAAYVGAAVAITGSALLLVGLLLAAVRPVELDARR